MKLTVIVEGGGNTRADQAELRRGFSKLFEKVRPNPKVKVECGGGRTQAFEDFRRALDGADGTRRFLLLVDSETAVSETVWKHVARRLGDGWKQPAPATDEDLHFMVQTMEAWLLSDREALAVYYGPELKPDKLPKASNLETISKDDLYRALQAATKGAKTKGAYAKSHGFELIGRVDPAKVRKACPKFGERFFKAIETIE